MAGVPYDGKLTKADGKGLWWEGLDPQDLYAQNQPPGSKPDAAYCQKFYNGKGCSGGEERALRLHPWLNKPGLSG